MKLTYRIILIFLLSICVHQSYSEIVVPKWMAHIARQNKRYLKKLINKKSESLGKALGIHMKQNSFIGDTVSPFMSLLVEINMDSDNLTCAVQGKILYADSCGEVTAEIELVFNMKQKMKDNVSLMDGTLKRDYDLNSIGIFLLRCKNGAHSDLSDISEQWVGADNKLMSRE